MRLYGMSILFLEIAMRMLFVHLCIGLLLILQIGGCGSSGGVDDVEDFFREPDPAAIESTLKTTIPVVAMLHL